jgi:hypothetical protein
LKCIRYLRSRVCSSKIFIDGDDIRLDATELDENGIVTPTEVINDLWSKPSREDGKHERARGTAISCRLIGEDAKISSSYCGGEMMCDESVVLTRGSVVDSVT